MIDLNRIRSLKTLEEMKQILTDFISFDPTVIVSIYEEENDWGKVDYEADIEEAKEFLEHVEKRMKSLGNYLNNPNKDKKKKVKINKNKNAPKPVLEIPSEECSSSE